MIKNLRISNEYFNNTDCLAWPEEFGYIRFEDNQMILTRYINDELDRESSIELDELTSLLKSDIEGLLMGGRKLFYHNMGNRTSSLHSTNVEISIEYQQ